MEKRPPNAPSEAQCREFRHELGDLIARFGGTRSTDLEDKLTRCVAQIVDALASSSSDGRSLSPLDVVRIRAGKFAATQLPPGVFRDPAQLAALRRAIHDLALPFVGEAGSRGSRFPPTQR
jgi:hypothetical protein